MYHEILRETKRPQVGYFPGGMGLVFPVMESTSSIPTKPPQKKDTILCTNYSIPLQIQHRNQHHLPADRHLLRCRQSHDLSLRRCRCRYHYSHYYRCCCHHFQHLHVSAKVVSKQIPFFLLPLWLTALFLTDLICCEISFFAASHLTHRE